MGRLFIVELKGRTYTCLGCEKMQLAQYSHRISKDLELGGKEAYFFEKVVNVSEGSPEEMTTTHGRYTVSPIACVNCGSEVGIKYLTAFEANQKFRENRYALKRDLLIGEIALRGERDLGTDDDED